MPQRLVVDIDVADEPHECCIACPGPLSSNLASETTTSHVELARSARILPTSFAHSVKQQSSWDCGIACVAMFVVGNTNWVRLLQLAAVDDPELAHLARPSDDNPLAELAQSNGAPPRCAVATTRGEAVPLTPQQTLDLISAVYLRSNGGVFSAWTIDLVFLLHELRDMIRAQLKRIGGAEGHHGRGSDDRAFFAKVAFTATSFSSSADYEGIPFYDETFDDDEARVAARFSRAVGELHWDVRKSHVPIQTITRKLAAGRSAFIALVDARFLTCPCNTLLYTAVQLEQCCCCKLLLSALLRAVSRAGDGRGGSSAAAVPTTLSSYMGHFVVLVGYDAVNGRILYRNPARSDSAVCGACVKAFDHARTAHGTDEDLVEVVFA